jgi:predicted RNase H-like nuclease (RuvC/YqgF family)
MPVKKNSKMAKKIVKPSEKENRILKNENKFLNATIDELKTRLNTLDSSKDREREIIEKHFNEELLKAKEIIENSQKENEELSNELTTTQQQFKKLMLQIQQVEQQPQQEAEQRQSGSFLTRKIMDLSTQEVIEGAKMFKEILNPSQATDPMTNLYLEFGKKVVGDTLTQLSKNVFAKNVAKEQSDTIKEATTGVA